MPGGTYTLEIGSSAHEVLLSQKIEVEDEYIPIDLVYNLMTPICDMMKHPVGKDFVDGLMPQVQQGLKHIGMDIDAMRRYALWRPVAGYGYFDDGTRADLTEDGPPADGRILKWSV